MNKRQRKKASTKKWIAYWERKHRDEAMVEDLFQETLKKMLRFYADKETP